MKLKIFALLFGIILLFLNSSMAIILNNPPETVPITPQDTHVVEEKLVKFTWNFYDIDNDTQNAYWIIIADNGALKNPIINTIKTTPKEEVYFNIGKDNTYYWMVQTYDGKDWGKWSSIQTFALYTSQIIQPIAENKCEDGTLYNECNNDFKYCINGNLIEDCSKCGCPANNVCQENGICKEVIQITPEVIQKKSIFKKIIDFIKLLFST